MGNLNPEQEARLREYQMWVNTGIERQEAINNAKENGNTKEYYNLMAAQATNDNFREQANKEFRKSLSRESLSKD